MIQCCPPKSNNHPQCYPILIPQDDPFYGEWEEDCLNFVRTAMCSQCKLGPREQVNQITAFIDASMVYGSTDNETRSLWTRSGPGKNKVQRLFYFYLLSRSHPSVTRAPCLSVTVSAGLAVSPSLPPCYTTRGVDWCRSPVLSRSTSNHLFFLSLVYLSLLFPCMSPLHRYRCIVSSSCSVCACHHLNYTPSLPFQTNCIPWLLQQLLSSSFSFSPR